MCVCVNLCVCALLNLWVHLGSVCKSFLTGCLFEYVFVCVCVYVCARVRRHSSTFAGTPRYSYTHTCVGRASRSHVRKVSKLGVLVRTSFKHGDNSISNSGYYSLALLLPNGCSKLVFITSLELVLRGFHGLKVGWSRVQKCNEYL